MDWLHDFVNIFLHLDRTLEQVVRDYGLWVYALLFVIIFCETGLVITPFLPGDSLLFAVGALAARPGFEINLPLVMFIMATAAVIGDAVNYSIGYRIGPRVFHSETSRLLNRKHLIYAHEFYEKYGGKTIILARFIPIIRTFAPFVAGIGRMTYLKFAVYNVTGGIGWVVLLTLAGHWFGGVSFVRKHFELVILAIIIISVMPAVYEFWRAHRQTRAKAAPPAQQTPAAQPLEPSAPVEAGKSAETP